MDTFSEGAREIRRLMNIQKKLVEDAHQQPVFEQVKLKGDPKDVAEQLVGIMESSASGLRKALDRESWTLVEVVADHLEAYASEARRKLQERYDHSPAH